MKPTVLHRTQDGWFQLRRGRRIVAYCCVGASISARSDAHLTNFFVLPGSRGQGLGHRLMGCVLPHLAARRESRVTLDVDSNNEAAIRVYQRAGFEYATKWWRTSPVDSYRMIRYL